ncbi:MAG: ankyrin repeat domain-containing protein, partial [Candidatus Theseobacter exili]|nr:ankyrin repeat domain-containing protein [Candidatus Theseobacter exili]
NTNRAIVLMGEKLQERIWRQKLIPDYFSPKPLYNNFVWLECPSCAYRYLYFHSENTENCINCNSVIDIDKNSYNDHEIEYNCVKCGRLSEDGKTVCMYCGGSITVEHHDSKTIEAEKEMSFTCTAEDMFTAIENNNLETLESIIKQNPQLINVKDKDELNPLHCALLKSNTEIAKLLILQGANVNSASSNCVSPMFLAAHLGNVEIAQLLLVKGANVNLQCGIENNTALHAAAHGSGAESYRNCVKIADMLLLNGASINPKNTGGSTPLYEAAFNGNLPVASLLVEKGADLNHECTKGSGFDSLNAAKLGNHQLIVDLLLDAGAEIRAMSIS